MSGGGIRTALGAIKDSTTVNLAKVNSDYKELDIAIVRATSHYERPAKEKHVRAIIASISSTRPRADVAYCINGLARRLSKTRNWAVALKTLIVIHRALKETDQTFHEELINYGRNRGHIFNMAQFKDETSPETWDYSAWVRSYAQFLEEKLECFYVLKFDVVTNGLRTKDLDTPKLLEQLPALQQLLFRLLGCLPQGVAVRNTVIHLALSLVVSESIKIYQAMSDGITNLTDKFFKMQRQDAFKAFDIHHRAEQQAQRLSEFYQVCKNLDIGRGEKFIKIEQPLASLVESMEDYLREAVSKDQQAGDKSVSPAAVLAIEYNKNEQTQEVSPPPEGPEPESEPVKQETPPLATPPDLMDLNDPVIVAVSELDEKNALALAIVPLDASTTTTDWELALITDVNSNLNSTTASQLGGGFDKLTLDSLYDDAIRRSNQQNVSYNNNNNPWETPQSTATYDPFYGSNNVAAPSSVQMAAMADQNQAFMLHQQQQNLPMGPQQQQQQQQINPFGDPFVASVPVQGYYGQYPGLV
ncbi:putative clathrin assembly protein At5g35200 [Impatiens glandulifera]|uniref:putative clathrin assembly protein At5g35200 n=1 Tax=Impatiens glandulifera TaxID=253017 RepID=UPI001FB139AB|nr:putative clathrin assembly protein At5g35200 [Impatiens glandulifera]